jgi:transposase
MTDLVDKLVPDELWEIVDPLLPPPPRSPRGGRPRSVPDRNCLAGIIYMTRASIPWELLPARELGCGSYVTCWRRFAEWAYAGVFETLHLVVLDRLGEQGQLDWRRLLVDSASLRAKRGGPGGRKPSRPWQAGKQATPGHRRAGNAAGGAGQRGQRQRLRAV